MLRMLNSKPKLPWCCFGDFNELLEVKEKNGGAQRSHNLMQSFRDVLDDCRFVDLGYSGPEFTWNGRRHGEWIWERLDRGVANYDWLARYPTGRVTHLHCYSSDHRPILLALDPNGESQKWKQKPFRFEAMWVTDSECGNTVSRAWSHQCENGTPMFTVANKLKRCKKHLKKWSKEHFGNVKKQIQQTKEMLWKAEERLVRENNYEEVLRLKSELNVLLYKEEQMWHQRSQVQWIKSGDKNTRFFHGTATNRKRQNFIKGLRDADGNWQSEEAAFTKVLIDFYAELFTTSNPQNLERVLEGIQEVVSRDMNSKLTAPYKAEEVELAIKEMAPLKAPGLNGMPPLFYQTYWTEVGMDITQAVLSCLNSGSILKSINHTFITLIPKVKNPERVSEFRPISLCNVIYKVVSKVIANRLKPLLNSIISETQSAFVADKLITDNVLMNLSIR